MGEGHRSRLGRSAPAVRAVTEEGAAGDRADEEGAAGAVVDKELAAGVQKVHVTVVKALDGHRAVLQFPVATSLVALCCALTLGHGATSTRS